ncbi:HEAT repeat domain-containing protein [Chamaesiphon sp. VAR_48_metabat_135_sub]|uniref:HEAT repeat domain-containing protein n=1 Tax=Chamaesiphon sp. VAR_48_metabat_135_sub TaxID=2964699 RepID=UPI00286C49D7|nr:HEAT repeat domain-containing protein [Chamaesiphon sp. VAR_48_metabat_135_sub]
MSDNDELPVDLEQIDRDLRGRALDKQKIALDKLAQLSADIAVPMLARLLESSDFMQRRIAVMGLGNHRVESSFQLLAGVIKQDRDPNVMGEAANAIVDFGDRAIPLLVDLFKTTDNWLVRQSIIPLLIDTNSHAELLITAEIAIADETQSVKEVGILALGHLLNSPFQVRALSLLLALCHDPSWRNRWRATIAFQSLQNSATKAAVAELQQDKHFRVVAAALEVANHWASQSI